MDAVDDDAITAPGPRPPAYTLDMVDLPTFNFPLISVLGREIAASINSSCVKGNMGQMIVFHDRNTGHILDTMHDANNVLTDDDMAATSMLRRIMTSSCSLVREFYKKVKHYDNKVAAVKRVPVEIPSSLDDVNRLLNHCIGDHMMTPAAHEKYKMEDYESVNQWLVKHDHLKTRHFITNRHIFMAKEGHRNRYLSAFYAGELEGFILLYAHRLIRVLKKTLKSTNERGRYLMLFIDGLAPAIKKATRLKRQNRQEASHIKKEATAALHAACERLVLKIPPALMICALLDVMRIPLARFVNAKAIFLSLASCSEAEDDIVRLVCHITGLETPIKHFGVSDRKIAVAHDTENPSEKKVVMWSTVYEAIKKHSVSEQLPVQINLFSHDSDVLAKWNLTASHHRQVCKLISPLSSCDMKLEGCKFYRSRPPQPADDTFRRAPMPETVYDLTESPVMLTPESTLMVMLTKGSDYNTPLVSPGTSFDTQIRTEATMFESLTCICVSGWREYFSTVATSKKRSEASVDNIDVMGTISEANLSNKPCEKCGKFLVVPFWAVKFFFAAQATEFANETRHVFFPPTDHDGAGHKLYDMHAALAVNASANVMAFLTMGSFNQRVFGSMTASSKSIMAMTSEKPAADPAPGIKKRKNEEMRPGGKRKPNAAPVSHYLSMAVVKSMRAFFDKHTQGGIPVEGEAVRNARKALFGSVFPPTLVPTDTSVLDVFDALFGESAVICDTQNVWEEEEEGGGSNWLAKAASAFASKTEEEEKRNASAFQQMLQAAAAGPKNDVMAAVYRGGEEWSKLLEEFEKCMSVSNVKSTDGSVISTLSHILNNPKPIKGIDDASSSVPYSIKAMNLLVIVYMNMCGLQDPCVIDGGQLLPIIHQEYCSAHARTSTASDNYCLSNTDRDNFTAAVMEHTFICYGPEIGPESHIKQTKRQNWTLPRAKLRELKKMSGLCVKNCEDALAETCPSASEKIWTPGRGFMPVMGATVTKPWTPLGLWPPFISYLNNNRK